MRKTLYQVVYLGDQPRKDHDLARLWPSRWSARRHLRWAIPVQDQYRYRPGSGGRHNRQMFEIVALRGFRVTPLITLVLRALRLEREANEAYRMLGRLVSWFFVGFIIFDSVLHTVVNEATFTFILGNELVLLLLGIILGLASLGIGVHRTVRMMRLFECWQLEYHRER